MKNDIIIIHPNEYPEKLLKIKEMPKVLYCVGNMELLYKESFAIVGSRTPTLYGKINCENFAKELSLRNISIVSGMSTGIDEIAHKATLKCYGETIAVIGCGIGKIDSNEENELFKDIVRNNGLVITEYDNNISKSIENFPKRNRIIAALSEGVLVVEAKYRSGSSITANLAKKYDKNVFAIPGRIGDKLSVGTNNLIKKGAILTTNVSDILEYYPQFVRKKRKTSFKNRCRVKKEWKKIYGVLEEGEATMEEIKIKTGMNVSELTSALINMELEDIIIQNIGRGYRLI